MPPPLKQGKVKREARRSGSRNTTPSSSISAPLASPPLLSTAFLEIPIENLVIPTNIRYDDILERHGGNGGIPDPSHLQTMANDLKMLAELAKTRSEFNDQGMRELSKRRKEILDEERVQEQIAREKEEKDKEAASQMEIEEEKQKTESRSGKPKKERGKAREEKSEARPLNHGAHGVARQDGLDLPVKESPTRDSKEVSSPPALAPDAGSGSSSSLSEASPLPSPSVAAIPPAPMTQARAPSAESASTDDDRQPKKAPSQPQYQTFGPNPVEFDDPTIYEVREVTADMSDEEKKEIYCVSSFPQSDLHDLIAGTPPNNDFSNAAKPPNQVQAHTFAAYLEGYLRPLKEEDYGFLQERGDRVTPFLMPRRGKRHYTELWAEEDGGMALDTPEKPNPNHARGSLDQLDDEIAETDQISNGPLVNRLLACMRYEHRAPPSDDKNQVNGLSNGDTGKGELLNGINHDTGNTDEPNGTIPTKPIPPATALPEISRNAPNTSHLTSAQIDERLKAELRHIGFLAADQEPDYDAHNDDEVAERLRHLQAHLRDISMINGARKQRVLELTQDLMAKQEYTTILTDLDEQVQTAYQKRARTTGKSKKNVKRPGGPAGGAQSGAGGTGIGGAGGVTKTGIGDVARTAMTRRTKWESQIGPVFEGVKASVRGKGETIFAKDVMAGFMDAEKERWDEEVE